MNVDGRRRPVGWLVPAGGFLCATSSQVFYGPLFLAGMIASGVAAQALLGVGLAACWAIGVIGVSWLIAPYCPRASARWICVIAPILTAAAALTASSDVRVGLLCVGAPGGVVSSQALSAVRRQAPEGCGDVATGRASAIWFGLIAAIALALSWLVPHADVTAGLWALCAVEVMSAGLVGLVIDRGRLADVRVSWRAQLTIARARGSRLLIAVLMLSGGSTIAGQNYGVLEAVRLGLPVDRLAPWVFLSVPAAAYAPRFAARSARSTMLVIVGLAAVGFIAAAGTDLLTVSPRVRGYGVIAAFILIEVSAGAIWSAGQAIARPQRSLGEENAEGAIRQSAPPAGQALIGLALLPLWLTLGWTAVCLAALAGSTASIALVIAGDRPPGRHRRRRARTGRARRPACNSDSPRQPAPA